MSLFGLGNINEKYRGTSFCPDESTASATSAALAEKCKLGHYERAISHASRASRNNVMKCPFYSPPGKHS